MGHVELSGLETTRPLDKFPVSTIAQRLALGERAAHTLLHPTASTRPFIAHVLEATDHLGHLTVAGAHGAAVIGDEGVADQLLVSGSLDPPRLHAEEIGKARQDRRLLFHSRPSWNKEGQAHRRLAGAVTGEPKGERSLRSSDEKLLGIVRADDHMPDAGQVGERQVRGRACRRALGLGIQYSGRCISEPPNGSVWCNQRRIRERSGGANDRKRKAGWGRARGIDRRGDGGAWPDRHQRGESRVGSGDCGAGPPRRPLRRSASEYSCRPPLLPASLEQEGAARLPWLNSTRGNGE